MHNNKKDSECQTVPLFSVYVMWCRCTNKFYVGVTSQKVTTRIRQHKRGKQYVDREIRRLGWEGNFDWWITDSRVPANLISEREQFWVDFFDCVYPKGYNKTCGGISKLTVSDDTRERIRQKALERDMSGENNPMFGKHHTNEAKETIGRARLGKPAWNKGIPCPEEQKAILREKALERDTRGENNPFYGKHHPEEAKERNRQAHLGKPGWNKGVPCSEKTKAILREKALARHAARRAAKAVAEENLTAANSTPTSLSTLSDAVIIQQGLSSEIAFARLFKFADFVQYNR